MVPAMVRRWVGEMAVSARSRALGVIASLAIAVSVACGGVKGADDGGTSSDAGDGQDASTTDGGRDGGPPDGGPPDGAATDAAFVPEGCAASPPCGVAGSVATKEEIAAIGQNCTAWGPPTDIDSQRPKTPTYVATESVSVCPADFALPEDCEDGSCFAAIYVSVDPELVGVDPIASCDGVQVAAGARFRLGFNIRPEEPGGGFRTAEVHFERPCDAPCVNDELRCEANDSCYPGDQLCFLCNYDERELCACRSPEGGVLADCTECTYFYFPLETNGLCVQGRCELEVDCSTCPCP
jgi:hypothetical protein